MKRGGEKREKCSEEKREEEEIKEANRKEDGGMNVYIFNVIFVFDERVRCI